MYFSGHLIDSYSSHISAISHDKISEILESFSEENEIGGAKYKDRSAVKIVGIITAKKTKIIKNGDTMAFLTVEDRFSEIEVIVFARSYKQFSDYLVQETAVVIDGTVSAEEGEGVKVLLSSIEPLKSDAEFSHQPAQKTERRIYIKVANLSDPRINNIGRISALNRGDTKVVLFDESRKKYCAMKDVALAPTEKVLSRLRSIFSEENVVLK